MTGPNREVFEAWRLKSEEDYYSAQLLIANGGPPATICFLCQQTAEKLLKGFALFHGGPLKRIHHLDALLEDCVAIDPSFATLAESVVFLKRYYIASRYPDDIPEDVPPEKAAQALTEATRIRDMVLSHIC
jgi:HEPN domain-containing protein